MNRLTMENADAIKKSVTAKQIKHMEALYDDMCHEMTLRAIRIANKTNFSSYVQRALYSQLKRQLSEVSEEYAKKTVKDIKDGMFRVSNAVVADNSDWLSKLGFGTSKEIAQAFSHIPKDVVCSIASGKLYKQGWGLTKSIWGSNQQIIKNINTIVAEGVGQNLSVQEIAENIQNYTGKKPNWNFKCRDGRRIYSRKVSYDAQRVARTCTQHAYQQSFVNMVKDNPFIEYIIWRATGSRACPLCRSRDGMLFKKDEVPLDHPNGMCTLEPFIPSYGKINVELADWFNSDIGDFPEIDEFAYSLGFKPKDIFRSVKEVKADGFAKAHKTSQSFQTWFKHLTPKEKAQAEVLKDKSGQGWDKWFKANIQTANPSAGNVPKFSKREWLKNLDNNNLSEMDVWCNEWLETITEDEYHAVWEYTGKTYREMNGYLRGFEKFTFYGKEIKDAQTALEKATLPKDVIVRRGSNYNMLLDLFKIKEITPENKSKFIGAIVEDKGFMSTSPDPDGGFDDIYEYVVKLPEGSQAMYVAPISKHAKEKEILVNAGGKYVIHDVEFDENGNFKRIYMTMQNLNNKTK